MYSSNETDQNLATCPSCKCEFLLNETNSKKTCDKTCSKSYLKSNEPSIAKTNETSSIKPSASNTYENIDLKLYPKKIITKPEPQQSTQQHSYVTNFSPIKDQTGPKDTIDQLVNRSYIPITLCAEQVNNKHVPNMCQVKNHHEPIKTNQYNINLNLNNFSDNTININLGPLKNEPTLDLNITNNVLDVNINSKLDLNITLNKQTSSSSSKKYCLTNVTPTLMSGGDIIVEKKCEETNKNSDKSETNLRIRRHNTGTLNNIIDFYCRDNELIRFTNKNNFKRQVHDLFGDLASLYVTLTYLRTCGWYYENINYADAEKILKDTEPGTFIVRDSSNQNFIFAITAQTATGRPTSIRIAFDGLYRLDCAQNTSILEFECVMELIDYYINYFNNSKQRPLREVVNRRYANSNVTCRSATSANGLIMLKKPLRYNNVPSLQHLCRLTINRQLTRFSEYRFEVQNKIFQLGLPSYLEHYLSEYPFSI